MTLSIGGLARKTGTKVPTIRYYEQIGLLNAPLRSAGNQRRFPETAVARLKFIRHARALGFALDDIRALILLSDHPRHPCEDADAIAERHLADVKERIATLERLRGELERMVACHGDGTLSNCRVIEVLADHRLCQSEH